MKASAEAEHEKFSGLINKTKGNISSYSNQIAGAEAQVAALEAQIEEQNKNISALQKQLAEEMANPDWRLIPAGVTFPRFPLRRMTDICLPI